MAIALNIVLACVYAEFVGYWLHVLLHSEKIGYLSRNHMIHHLLIYGPDKPQRQSTEYLGSTFDRAGVAGIGLEWLGPIVLLLAVTAASLMGWGLGAGGAALFCGVALLWGLTTFWYMHDAMHLRGFWMEGSASWLRHWFLSARRRHDIHHMDLTDDGRMSRNFGICFFGFDRLFGTLEPGHRKFNRAGLAAARRRYAYIYSGRTSDGV
jgi:sterol desaturase/sphingolipid hydroxylase (fatty acid hydroxylase superfamily)